MDLPITNTFQRHPDHPSAGVRASPTESSNSSPRTMIPPPPNPFALAPSGRTPVLSTPLSQIGSRSPVGFNVPPYSHSYSTSSASPSGVPGGLQDSQLNEPSSLSAAGISPTQLSATNLHAQKRAYRQRRKDPSCDACRERKVKCDATETSACSECSSRNHKCQFTKETNRRMSSIKQVQDLQSQVVELRQENNLLKSRRPDTDSMDTDRGTSMPRQVENRSEPVHRQKQRAQPPLFKNFEPVQQNVRTQSFGIFELPTQHRQTRLGTNTPSVYPEVPTRADFAFLSRFYNDSIHEFFPILHWPTFQNEVDLIYTAKTFQGMTQEWISLFFAVMACGALQTMSVSGGSPRISQGATMYYETACQGLTPWPDVFSETHAQLALLLSIYSYESGMKSRGSMWLATAVRIAQELNLGLESEGWPVFAKEMRRRLWWSIFTFDRMTALANDRPMLIHQEDFDVPFPSSIADRYIQPQGYTRAATNEPPYTGFAAVIHAVQAFSDLRHDLKSSVVAQHTLQIHDEAFHISMRSLPDSYQLDSDAILEPSSLYALLTLQFARFTLYRHNMSPVCQAPERAEALRRCTFVAQDTAKYIARTMRHFALTDTPKSVATVVTKTWQNRVVQLASNLLCLHLWRCILVLCFRADYEGALMCLSFSSAIGDLRKVNTACAHNLVFFLDRLTDRVRGGNGSLHQLERDEEMLVYVSGDMQGSREHSWVWAGSDFTSESFAPPSNRTGTQSPGHDEHMQSTPLPLRPNTGFAENGHAESDAWARVERCIRQLMEEHQQRTQPAFFVPPHNPVKRVQLAQDASPSNVPKASTTPTNSRGPIGANRISIANII